MAQFIYGHRILYVENDAPVSTKLKLTPVHFFEGIYQRCLAVEEYCVFSFLRFDLVDSDQASTFGLCREIARLPPFQSFFQLTHAVCS